MRALLPRTSGPVAARSSGRNGARAMAAAACGGGGGGGGGQITTAVWEATGQGQRTEVLELQAAQPAPAVQLLIIPGNPGAASFYTPFMRSLHAQLRGRAAIACASNLGMVSGGWRRWPAWNAASPPPPLTHSEPRARGCKSPPACTPPAGRAGPEPAGQGTLPGGSGPPQAGAAEGALLGPRAAPAGAAGPQHRWVQAGGRGCSWPIGVAPACRPAGCQDTVSGRLAGRTAGQPQLLENPAAGTLLLCRRI